MRYDRFLKLPQIMRFIFRNTSLVELALWLALTLVILAPVSVKAAVAERIPVILDTDIGDDIDDTWALGLLLSSPEFDLKLVVGDHGKTLYRARLIAKLLEVAGRTDVPIGLGWDINASGDGPQAGWVRDYDLNKYPGKIYPDGVRAMMRIIQESDRELTLIAIGPVENLAAALGLDPGITNKVRFAGMHGSVRRGYGNSPTPAPEYNVVADARACQKVFEAGWGMAITPLDTCGIIDLSGDRYARLTRSAEPLAKAIVENYRLWSAGNADAGQREAYRSRSSTLFDTVAVYLAMPHPLLREEDLGIRVTQDGYTRIDPNAKMMKVATEWQDLDGFRDLLVERLTTPAR